MIKGVEGLRKGECILCEHGEFERPDDLFDDFVEPGGVQDQRPELVAAVGAIQLA